jgi:hypothetical protein
MLTCILLLICFEAALLEAAQVMADDVTDMYPPHTSLTCILLLIC